MLQKSFEKKLRNLEKRKLVFRSFYFDVKRSPHLGPQPHPLTQSILENLRADPPRLILVTDDFALNEIGPHLATLKIPFVFAGLNGNVPKGIQASDFTHYTGVLERYYLRDSLRLLQRILKKQNLNLLILLDTSPTEELFTSPFNA